MFGPLTTLAAEIGWARVILTPVLYLIAITAVALAVPIWGLLFFLASLCGEGPNGSLWLVSKCSSPSVVGIVFTGLGTWWALWLWNKPRGRLLSFPVAVALLASSIQLVRWFSN